MASKRTSKVLIMPGENLWLWLRTARDGADRDEVADMAGAAMYHALGAVNTTEEPWHIIQTSDDPAQWRVGYARPIEVVDVRRAPQFGGEPPIPPGVQLGDRQWHPEGVPAITTRADVRPWFVLVRFWWRGFPQQLDLPAFRVNWFGVRHPSLWNADWLLDAAWQPFPEKRAADPGDQSWGGTQERRIKKSATMLAKVAGGGIVLAGAAAMVFLAVTKSKGDSK